MDLSDYPKKEALKDDTEVILRPMEKNDKDELLKFFKKLPEEDRLFLKDDVTKEEIIQKWVDNIDYSKILPILAIVKDEIIGDATLHRTSYGWTKHVGEIRLVVAKEFRKKGIGTILAKELVNNATNIGLDKITAQMTDQQTSAIKAFEKLGFIKEATFKNHIIDIRGRKHNLIIMCNDVSHLWRKMEDLLMDWRPVF
ncbi:MAG: GNAT family protein [Bacteroidota bacterium]